MTGIGTVKTNAAAGNATTADVLYGKTFSASGTSGQAGGMPNNNDVTQQKATHMGKDNTGYYVRFPYGYYPSRGAVSGNSYVYIPATGSASTTNLFVEADANLAAGNIKKGTTVLGITGTYDNGSANVKGNATAAQVLQSTGANNTGTAIKFSSASAGSDVQGTMVNRGAPTSTINCGGSYNISAGYYSGGTITAQTLASATSAGTITNNGTAGQTNQILNGYVAFSDGVQYTGKMPSNSNGAATVVYNPNKATSFYVYMPWGYYPNAGSTGSYANRGYVSVSDANLKSANIKSGVSIFGVAGSSTVVDTSAGTVTANSQLLNGYKAYSDGTLYTGTANNPAGKTIVSAQNQILSGYSAFKADGTRIDGTLTKGYTGTKDYKLTIPNFGSTTGQTTGGYGGGAETWGQVYLRVSVTASGPSLIVLDNNTGYSGWESWVKLKSKYMQYDTAVSEHTETLGGNYVTIANA